MNTWNLHITTENGSQIVVRTGLIDYKDAERYVYRLYGNNVVIGHQELA